MPLFKIKMEMPKGYSLHSEAVKDLKDWKVKEKNTNGIVTVKNRLGLFSSSLSTFSSRMR